MPPLRAAEQPRSTGRCHDLLKNSRRRLPEAALHLRRVGPPNTPNDRRIASAVSGDTPAGRIYGASRRHFSGRHSSRHAVMDTRMSLVDATRLALILVSISSSMIIESALQFFADASSLCSRQDEPFIFTICRGDADTVARRPSYQHFEIARRHARDSR